MFPDSRRGRVDLLLVLSLVLLPWSVLTYGNVGEGFTTLLFAWGLVDPATGEVTWIYGFLAHTRGLPNWILAWPVGVLCLAAAFASTAVGRARGRDGDAPTAALLALVGVAVFSVSWGFSAQPGRTGLPVGTVLAWVAGARYWLRSRRTR
ncbi:MAG: TIGR04206 family protein [Halolamina sp.]